MSLPSFNKYRSAFPFYAVRKPDSALYGSETVVDAWQSSLLTETINSFHGSSMNRTVQTPTSITSAMTSW
jgi:hypothetical protein